MDIPYHGNFQNNSGLLRAVDPGLPVSCATMNLTPGESNKPLLLFEGEVRYAGVIVYFSLNAIERIFYPTGGISAGSFPASVAG